MKKFYGLRGCVLSAFTTTISSQVLQTRDFLHRKNFVFHLIWKTTGKGFFLQNLHFSFKNENLMFIFLRIAKLLTFFRNGVSWVTVCHFLRPTRWKMPQTYILKFVRKSTQRKTQSLLRQCRMENDW